MTLVQFMFSSTLTLIYQAMSPKAMVGMPEPLSSSPECVEAARTTLSCLNEVWDDAKDQMEDYWLMFINWLACTFSFIELQANAE